MKQTAVEWLIDELTDNGIRYLDLVYEIIEQAIEMEKEQIGNAYVKGQSDCDMFTMESEVEEYYNNTFKKDKLG
jgi:hypothetical protein